MSTHKPFVDAVLADPGNDVPRLVYADWQESSQREEHLAHAEFIRLQCHLAKMSPYDLRRVVLHKREGELLRQWEDLWCGDLVKLRTHRRRARWWPWGGWDSNNPVSDRPRFEIRWDRGLPVVRPGFGVLGEDFELFVGLEDLRQLDVGPWYYGGAEFRHLAAVAHLHTVRIDRRTVEAEDLSRLSECAPLRRLELKTAKLTIAGFAQLGKLKQLNALNLSQTRSTEVGLAHLKKLAGLNELDLSATGVTDQSLAWLSGLSHLAVLKLQETAIGDAGLRHVAAFANLQQLSISPPKFCFDELITAAGFACIAQMTKLTQLDLSNLISLTDEALKKLSLLGRLRTLSLVATRMTDSGLEHLAEMKNLRTTDVSYTRVSPDGVRWLRNARPDLTVRWSYDYDPS